MSALANHAFAKMNGIGNEIVVVDLRDKPAAVTAEDARAVASPAGVPYDQFVTELNTDFNPFTAFNDIEGPLGADIQNLLELTGIQQDLLDPVLGLVGSLGGIFTS